MKIGLVADSHDHHRHLEQLVTVLRHKEVTQVLHAGDYINPGSVRLFQGLHLTGVLGNNDGDLLHLSKAFEAIGGSLHGQFAALTLGGRTIGLHHGTEKGLKEALIGCGAYDILVFGHTHQPDNRQVGRTLVLNPGSLHGFSKPATAMILNLETLTTELLEL